MRRTSFDVIAITFLFLLAILLFLPTPPAVVPASASPNEFSAARAMKHLNVIARKPHPMGSAEHAQVRTYLLNELASLGIHPEVQTATVNWQGWGGYRLGRAHNILAKLPGYRSTKAVLLVAHYDTVPTSPGAADNSSGVATMLETLRALSSAERLRNDVILLFTDGEEIGVFGAKAFADEHDWARNVGLLVHFDSGGNSGPAWMVEVSKPSSWLLKSFGQAVSRPVTNSLLMELSKVIPSSVSDFDVLERLGAPGFNFFAARGSTVYYHSILDNPALIDQRTIQHLGSYAVGLVRHFGSVDFASIHDGSDSVYFDLFGRVLVSYSTAWTILLMVLTLFVFGGVITIGLRDGRLTFSGIAFGVLGHAASMLACYTVIALLWKLIRLTNSNLTPVPQGQVYNSVLFNIGFVCLEVFVALIVFAFFRRGTSTENLVIGAMVWWAIPMVLTSCLWRGASFIFTWPLLFALLPLGLLFVLPTKRVLRQGSLLAWFLSPLPGLTLACSLICLAFDYFEMASPWATVPVAYALGLFNPYFSLVCRTRTWIFASVAACVGLGFILTGIGTFVIDAGHPKASQTLFYALDFDTGNAIWGSTGLDEWTKRFIMGKVRKSRLVEFFPLSTSTEYFTADAPRAGLSAPIVRVVEEQTDSEIRRWGLQIVSINQAPELRIYLRPRTRIVEASVDGKEIFESEVFGRPRAGEKLRAGALSGQLHDDGSPLLIYYNAPPAEGVHLRIGVTRGSPFELRMVERLCGIPRFDDSADAERARPPHLMETPSGWGTFYPNCDSTLVAKSFTF